MACATMLICIAAVAFADGPTGKSPSPSGERFRAAINADQAIELQALLLRSGSPSSLATLTARNGRTALMVAAKYGDMPLVDRLLAAGAHVDDRTATGGTPLLFAALGGHRDIARILLDRGADIDAVGSNGWGVVMLAAAKGHTGLLRWLIAAGADPNRPDVYRFTPLMRAIANNKSTTVDVLLGQRDVDIAAVDEAGNTALHHAVARGDKRIVSALLDAGADASQVNRDGQPALASPVRVP